MFPLNSLCPIACSLTYAVEIHAWYSSVAHSRALFRSHTSTHALPIHTSAHSCSQPLLEPHKHSTWGFVQILALTRTSTCDSFVPNTRLKTTLQKFQDCWIFMMKLYLKPSTTRGSRLLEPTARQRVAWNDNSQWEPAIYIICCRIFWAAQQKKRWDHQ